MSAGARRSAARAARLAVALYPTAWRARYGEEMLALLEDDPPGPRGLLSLLSGALVAHARPGAWAAGRPAAERMRLSIGAVFACWIAVSVAGAGFQKTTEDPPFAAAAAAHPLLGAAREAILAGAGLGAAAVALGGIPLLGSAVLRALSRRDRALALMLACPPLAIALFAAAAAGLAAAAPPRDGGFPAGFVLVAGAPVLLAGAAVAAVCALAPRAVMRRTRPGAPALRRATRAGVLLALAMGLVTVGLVLYAAALGSAAPALASEASGPVGTSVLSLLIAQGALATLATAAALVGVGRGLRAASAGAE